LTTERGVLAEQNTKASAIAAAHNAWKIKTEAASQIPQLEASVADLTLALEACKKTFQEKADQYKSDYGTASGLSLQCQKLERRKREQEAAMSEWTRMLQVLRSNLEAVQKEQCPFSSLIVQTHHDLAIVDGRNVGRG